MKFIKVNGGADSAYAAPLSSLLSVHSDTDSKVSVVFKSSLPLNLVTIGNTAAAAAKAYDEIIFSITADQEDEVVDAMLQLLTAVGTSKNNMIVELGTAIAGVTAVDSITLGVAQQLRLTAQDLRDMNILKYYRLTRKWVCKTYGLKDADLELLIYLDCKGRFTRNDFINGVYTYSWDKARWERLKREGWIETWRHRNRTTIMYSVFKTSFKCSQMISRIYRILLGEEDLPTSERSVFYKNKSYTDKVYNKAIDDMIKDKER